MGVQAVRICAVGLGALLSATAPALAEKAKSKPAALLPASVQPASLEPASRGSFSPLAVAFVLDRVCKPAVEQLQGVDRLAAAHGLQPGEARADFRWALPEGARVWAVDSIDSNVFVYAYGPHLTQCGAVIARPLSGSAGQRVQDEMMKPARGFSVDSQQELAGGVRFTRMKAAGFRFADIMDYPSSAETPGVVKVELLPIS